MPTLVAPAKSASFGYKMAWFAVESADPAAVAAALDLRDPAPCDWAAGIDAAYGGHRVFVTPPVAGWVLAPAAAWFGVFGPDPAKPAGARLRALSSAFGRAQLFASNRGPEFHLWADAKAGRVARAYCYAEAAGGTVWTVGRPPAAELAVGRFDADTWPGEASVMLVAGALSINPTAPGQWPAGATGVVGDLFG